MYFQNFQLGALVLLAMSPFAVANEVSDTPAKSAKRMICNPECQWLDAGSATPMHAYAPSAMAEGATMEKSEAGEAKQAPLNAAPTEPRLASTELRPVAPAKVPARSALDMSVDHLARAWVAEDTNAVPVGGRLDLWQAVTLAVETYPSIRDAAAQVDQQREGIDVAKAGYLPTIQTGLNTGKQGAYGNGQSLSLSASQMIYDFGKVSSSVRSAEAGVRVQQFQLMATTDEVARQSALTLVEVSHYSDLLGVANGQIDGIKRLRELARQRASEGASTQADLIQAQSRVEAAQSSLMAIQTQLQQQRIKLRIMIGRDIPEPGVSVPESRLLQAVQGIEPTPEYPVSVRLAEVEVEAAQAQLSLAKSNTMPTFTVDGGVSKYMGNAGEMAGDRVYTLTVGVKHDLFAGGAPSARVRGAGQAVRAAEERIYTKKLEASDEWTALQQQMNGLQERLKVLAEREKNIHDTQQLYREQYLSLGTRTLLDLLNTEQEIFQARSDLVNARHELWAAQVSFINATGHMHDIFQIKGEI
ncbi:adhesin transport system outer membrane protein [Pseudomonas nitritireducens]|uniref:Adhesin transport system outer membrane protein n=1 Tax=Pseudomonas nitroreducens TaxID=46680 RepID=A0A7W7KRH8_PSENT|nr:TolC family outer membrane protein [Pseudomonas nitritireducens]MBB4867629.1 adhesin transport system outer membrane protein [Pseudomonas nitritireducens]